MIFPAVNRNFLLISNCSVHTNLVNIFFIISVWNLDSKLVGWLTSSQFLWMDFVGFLKLTLVHTSFWILDHFLIFVLGNPFFYSLSIRYGYFLREPWIRVNLNRNDVEVFFTDNFLLINHYFPFSWVELYMVGRWIKLSRLQLGFKFDGNPHRSITCAWSHKSPSLPMQILHYGISAIWWLIVITHATRSSMYLPFPNHSHVKSRFFPTFRESMPIL